MKWAVVPALAMLLNSVITTIIQVLSPSQNTFQHGVVHGRSSAQIPSADGQYGPQPAAESIVVFNLGVQFNHPLGVLAPNVKKLGEYLTQMTKELIQRKEELGLLSHQMWRAIDDRASNGSLNVTFYFRNVEAIHKFAHEDLHRTGWHWYETVKPFHVGVYHETFIVPAGQYETIYDHCRPVLLGKGRVKTEDGVGKEGGGGEWKKVLVSADTPALKTQYARLSRFENGEPKP